MQKRPLTDLERRDWLRLARTENVGAITFRQLIQRYGTAAKAIEAIPELAARGGKRSLRLPGIASIEDEIARAKDKNVSFIALCEPDYPEALAAIEDAPPVFLARGQTSLLHKRSIGIVGARNASLNGRKLAETLARGLGQNGIVIVSGLARGIDASAHKGSVATGSVAVLAGGVDIVYPEENRAIYDELMQAGCVISDQPLGCTPRAQLFPRRNRLISGLSLGVVVVEAAYKSGSLITARLALEQGREVFAVPGSPLDPRCAGTNDLLRQGAVLTENAGDILYHIHALPSGLAEPPGDEISAGGGNIDESHLDEARERIMENLGPSPIAIDELIRESGIPAPVALTILLELELAGRLERQAGQRVALIANTDMQAGTAA